MNGGRNSIGDNILLRCRRRQFRDRSKLLACLENSKILPALKMKSTTGKKKRVPEQVWRTEMILRKIFLEGLTQSRCYLLKHNLPIRVYTAEMKHDGNDNDWKLGTMERKLGFDVNGKSLQQDYDKLLHFNRRSLLPCCKVSCCLDFKLFSNHYKTFWWTDLPVCWTDIRPTVPLPQITRK